MDIFKNMSNMSGACPHKFIKGRKCDLGSEIVHITDEGAYRVDENKSSVNRVTVSIFNEEYVVKGEENPEYIEMLASFVDRRMKMIQQRNPNLSSTKVAVLTALNLADELNKLQEDYDELVKNLEEEKKSRG